jgi:hypothetical protein
MEIDERTTDFMDIRRPRIALYKYEVVEGTSPTGGNRFCGPRLL